MSSNPQPRVVLGVDVDPVIAEAASYVAHHVEAKLLRAYSNQPLDDVEMRMAESIAEIKAQVQASKRARSFINAMDARANAMVMARKLSILTLNTNPLPDRANLDVDTVVRKLDLEDMKRERLLANVLAVKRKLVSGGYRQGVTSLPEAPTRYWNAVAFRLSAIHCLDTNDQFLQGNSDELAVGINYILPDGTVGYWWTSAGLGDIDPGESRSLNNSARVVGQLSDADVYHTFAYAVTVLEIDEEQFAQKFRDIYNDMKAELDRASVAAGTGVAIALGVPEAGPLIAQVIIKAHEWLAGSISNWLGNDFIGGFVVEANISPYAPKWDVDAPGHSSLPTSSYFALFQTHLFGAGAHYMVTGDIRLS